ALGRRLGRDLVGHHGAAAPRLQRRLRIMDDAAFRAMDRIALQIVEPRSAGLASALGAPFQLGHAWSVLSRNSRPTAPSGPPGRVPIATIDPPCQKVIGGAAAARWPLVRGREGCDREAPPRRRRGLASPRPQLLPAPPTGSPTTLPALRSSPS